VPSIADDRTARLRGIIPVLPTPFTDDGGLDLESLDRLIEHALTWGAHGLAILGVASEVEKLDAEEYRTIAEAAARKIAGRTPLVMGLRGATTQAAAQSAAIARHVGAHAVFAKAPAASRPEAAEAEALAYYLAIAQAADLPVMVQNFALAAGESGVIPLDALARVVRADPRIQYVKEETPPPAGNGKISQIRRALGEGVTVFSGSGGITLVDDLRRGASGCMPGAVLVRSLVRIHEHHAQGRGEEADRLQAEILPLIVFRARWGFAAVTKLILQELGILKTAKVRDPAGVGLDEQALWELRRLVRLLAAYV
jgi:4-hydroxy-tetrahydrodipicolinate synthase